MKYTEKQIVQIIQSISKRISEYFTLGYMTPEDIQQECFILGWEGLQFYNGKHPLEHYMYVRIRTRFLNLIRKHVRRKDTPCYTCHASHLEPNLYKPDHENNQFCQKYLLWLERNNTKSLLFHTLCSGEFDIQENNNSNYDDKVCPEFSKKVIEILQDKLPAEFSELLNKLLGGIKLRRKTMMPLIEECKKIIKDCGIEWEELNGYENS